MTDDTKVLRKPLTRERIDELQALIPKDTPFFEGLVIFTRLIEASHGIVELKELEWTPNE